MSLAFVVAALAAVGVGASEIEIPGHIRQPRNVRGGRRGLASTFYVLSEPGEGTQRAEDIDADPGEKRRLGAVWCRRRERAAGLAHSGVSGSISERFSARQRGEYFFSVDERDRVR